MYYYDSAKKWLTAIARVGSGNESASFDYDEETGQLETVFYGNGAYTQYQYYGNGAVKNISHYSQAATLIASVEYDYDLAGNVISVALDDSLTYNGDATISYQYDDLHRLTRETCSPAQGSYRAGYDWQYAYDAAGNRIWKCEGTGDGRYETCYSYSRRNELTWEARYQVVEEWNEETQEWFDSWYYQSGYEYGYDLRGNLYLKSVYNDQYAGVGTWVYVWTADDKLAVAAYFPAEWETWQKLVEYKYDLLGRRTAKRVTLNGQQPGPWRWYFYDGLRVIAEGTGTNDKIYYTAGISRDANGAKLFYHHDRLGNVLAVTDASGNLAAGYTMESFGQVLEVGTSTGYYSSQSDPQPYHITSKEYDAYIGLYFFNARWYNPAAGRWISREPAGIDGPNLYHFCLNNPIVWIDNNGL